MGWDALHMRCSSTVLYYTAKYGTVLYKWVGGVATLFQVTLFRGDFSPRDKIPTCQESEETLVRVGHHSKLPRVQGDMSPQGTLVQGRHSL